MSRSGSDTRQRQLTLSARFNVAEAEAIRLMADRTGTSVASLIRSATLNVPVPRQSRRPTVNHQAAARIIGELGRVADTLRAAAALGHVDPKSPTLPLRSAISLRCVRSAF
jgi:hypothetical protein